MKLILLSLFSVALGAPPIFGGNVQLLSSIPNGPVSETMQLDAAGNISRWPDM